MQGGTLISALLLLLVDGNPFKVVTQSIAIFWCADFSFEQSEARNLLYVSSRYYFVNDAHTVVTSVSSCQLVLY